MSRNLIVVPSYNDFSISLNQLLSDNNISYNEFVYKLATLKGVSIAGIAMNTTNWIEGDGCPNLKSLLQIAHIGQYELVLVPKERIKELLDG